MIGLYDLVQSRLEQLANESVSAVSVATSTADVESMPLGADATGVVIPLGESAAEIREAGLKVSQRVTIRFGVVLALVFPSGFEQFEPAGEAVKAALRGWLPPGCTRAVAYAGARLLIYEPESGGRWLHLFEFTTAVQDSYEVQQ